MATLLSNVNNLPKRLVNLYFFKHSKIPASSSDLNWVKTSFLSEFNMASTRVQAMKFAYNMFKFRKSYSNKAEFSQEGIFLVLQLFARLILSIKKLEIEKTKPTFIISVLKVEY